MKPKLRPTTLDEALRKLGGTGRRREILVDPEGGFFGTRTLAAALRKAAVGDIVLIPGGSYVAFELKRGIEIRSLAGTTAVIKGTVTIESENVALHGLEIQAEPGQPAILVKKGSAVLDDCTIHGGVAAGSPGSKANIHLRSCLITGADEGVVVTDGSTAEVASSRIANCRHGISLFPKTSCAVYHSRIEACINIGQSEPGAGILADQATLYCEGTTFYGNGVGLYLKQCPSTRLVSSYFHSSEASAIIATASANEELHMHSCAVSHQDSGECAQIALNGGLASMEHCQVGTAPSSALSAENARLELIDSKFESRDDATLDLRSCHISASGLECRSRKSFALGAAVCQGTVRQSRFFGVPPTQATDSPQLTFELCESGKPLESKVVAVDPTSPPTINHFIERTNDLVSQENIRNEMERLLRLAHAGQQRLQQGLPAIEQNFHCLFFGPPGTGKMVTAQLLAEGLHAFGAINIPAVAEISLENEVSMAKGLEKDLGVVFLRAPEATGSTTDQAGARHFVETLLQRPKTVVILAGERDLVRRLLRPSTVLDRTFRNVFSFMSFGPVELVTLFARFCEKEHIPLSPDAVRALLLAFHLYSDRKDRRFANTQGVAVLFDATQRRYLERCSLANRFDLQLEPRDLDIPQDKALRTALDRSPAFITFCPSCSKENPWLPGLNPRTVCLHCEAAYAANWGIWRDSATYRRTRETLTHTVESGAVARRANLPNR
ncbi:hypothetical protein BH09VER1_BH09VER1_06040 [soil metagenome]